MIHLHHGIQLNKRICNYLFIISSAMGYPLDSWENHLQIRNCPFAIFDYQRVPIIPLHKLIPILFYISIDGLNSTRWMMDNDGLSILEVSWNMGAHKSSICRILHKTNHPAGVFLEPPSPVEILPGAGWKLLTAMKTAKAKAVPRAREAVSFCRLMNVGFRHQKLGIWKCYQHFTNIFAGISINPQFTNTCGYYQHFTCKKIGCP